MDSETIRPSTSARVSLWRRFALIGPGLVFLASALGPQDIVANATAGAAYRYTFLWALALGVLARYVFLEASARYVLATGETLVAGYSRFGPVTLWMILVAVVVKRHITNLFQVLLLGLTMNWVLPLPFAHGAAAWSLFFWGCSLVLMYRGGYRAVELWCRPLVVMLGAALACAAVWARPDPGAIVRDFWHPSSGNSGDGLSTAFVIMALIGSSAGALSNLKYQAFLHERGWRDAEKLRVQRTDLAAAALGLLIMGALVQSAAAQALSAGTDLVRHPVELISAFRPTLGPLGSAVVAIGLWAAVFSTYTASNTGYSLIAADIIGHLSAGSQAAPAGRRPAYRGMLLLFVVPPLYALWTDWSPVWLALAASALEVVLMPITASLLLLLTMRRSRMGSLGNSMATNAALTLVILAALALTANKLWEWL